jgi:hypothetical protein
MKVETKKAMSYLNHASKSASCGGNIQGAADGKYDAPPGGGVWTPRRRRDGGRLASPSFPPRRGSYFGYIP